MGALWALAALLCVVSGAAAQANAPLIAGETGGWRQGRATFYGGPERFLQNFADRGPPPEYGFGDAIFGSCGYTQQVRATQWKLQILLLLSCPCTAVVVGNLLQKYPDEVMHTNVAFPEVALSAHASTDKDNPGSCRL